MTDQTGSKSKRGTMRFFRDERGNIMPMAAIAMIAMAGMVGGGVDMSRGYMVQNRLQNACDAGVLAGRRAIGDNGFDTAAQTQADNYFYTNFDEAGEGTTSTAFTPVSAEDGNRVDGTASTTMNTAVMKLFGFDSINLSVDCSASMSVGNSDVMMVLDTTGSMSSNLGGQSRMAALQNAMKSFYDTVKAASAGSNARVRYGFVPYSSSINVGSLVYNLNSSYIADEMTIQSLVPQYDEVEVEGDEVIGWEDPVYSTADAGYGDIEVFDWTDHSGSHNRRWKCEDALPNNSSWVNAGSNSSSSNETINGAGQKVLTTTTVQTQVRSSYRCIKRSRRNFWVQVQSQSRQRFSNEYETSDPIHEIITTTEFDGYLYKQVDDVDVSTFKTFASTGAITGDDGETEYSSWNGCIEERETVSTDNFSFSSILGITPSGATDLDIDTPPNTSDDATKWKPMWPEMARRRVVQQYGNYYYTNNLESEHGLDVSYTCPRQAQLLTEMSESAFDTYADSLTPSGNTYHDLGMIWGARLASPTGIFQSNVTAAPANGGSVARHIIFMTDGEMVPNRSILTTYGIERYDRRVTDNGQSEHADRHRARFLAVCQAARAKGMRVWVIAFASALTTNLETCASTDSAFTANNASQLNYAFQEIAKNVGELRVVQ